MIENQIKNWGQLLLSNNIIEGHTSQSMVNHTAIVLGIFIFNVIGLE
jgi:hypothetical protein